MESHPRIAITLGDPSGIGPEVIVKGLNQSSPDCRPIVIGDARTLKNAAERWAPDLTILPIKSIGDTAPSENSLEILDLNNVTHELPAGVASKEGGHASYDSIQKAVTLAMNHEIDAIVTAPINKEALHLAGHFYPGHTELLADLTETPHVALMLASDTMRVVLATTHVPVAEVHSLITKERVLRILTLTHQWLSSLGITQPHIGVTGLNPHCGDGGIFGREEEIAILPAIKEAHAKGWKVSGPFSADAFFGRYQSGQYDAVVTMYHDQGMIPIKMAAQDKAVNVTLGLPIIRTSVDHGTAYDIAGRGIAKPDSLLHALSLASKLAQASLTARSVAQ